MENSMALTSIGFLRYGLVPSTTISRGRLGKCIRRSSSGGFRIRAVQENEGPRRLVDIIRIIPDISRNYFRSPSRRALFGGISLLGGFYVAQTISLSFGALGVNDVIAAVLCVLITEYVTRFYYSRPKILTCSGGVLVADLAEAIQKINCYGNWQGIIGCACHSCQVLPGDSGPVNALVLDGKRLA